MDIFKSPSPDCYVTVFSICGTPIEDTESLGCQLKIKSVPVVPSILLNRRENSTEILPVKPIWYITHYDIDILCYFSIRREMLNNNTT